jgi:glycolate oxidase
MDSAGASSLKVSNSEEERNLFWAGRKSAFPAVGRISPDYLCMDGTIPRRRLPDMMVRMASLSQKYGLRVANVFHAGDGNLHPLILFDANQPGELQRAEGVGVEKRDLMGIQFTEDDMKQQQRLKCAFDADHLLNPGKMFPHLHRCAELGRLHVHKGKMPFPDLPRF